MLSSNSGQAPLPEPNRPRSALRATQSSSLSEDRNLGIKRKRLELWAAKEPDSVEDRPATPGSYRTVCFLCLGNLRVPHSKTDSWKIAYRTVVLTGDQA